MDDIELLNSTFELYMQKGKEAKEKGNYALAKRNFMLAGETMMKIAKISQGKLKEVRLNRAKRIVELSDRIGTEKEKKKDDASEEDDEVKRWQQAEIPNIHFSDVAGLEDVK